MQCDITALKSLVNVPESIEESNCVQISASVSITSHHQSYFNTFIQLRINTSEAHQQLFNQHLSTQSKYQ